MYGLTGELVGSILVAGLSVKCTRVVNEILPNKEAVTLAYEGHSYAMSGVDHYDSHFGIGTIHINGDP